MNFSNILTYFKGATCAHITNALGYDRVAVCKVENSILDIDLCVLSDLAHDIGLRVVVDTNDRNSIICLCGSREQFQARHDFMELSHALRLRYTDTQEELPLFDTTAESNEAVRKMKLEYINRIQNYIREKHVH